MAIGNDVPRSFRGVFKSVLPFTASVDFGSAGATDAADSFASADITVEGASLGDLVLVSGSIDLIDTTLAGTVTAANVVTVTISNPTTAAVNHGAMIIKGLVLDFDDEVGLAGE